MMIPLKNDRLIRALRRQPVDRPPVWLMRQAGRYLPEYRKLREEAPNFMQFCKTPTLACEATLQPLKRFDLDAAILFSDILVVPDAMGLAVEIEPKRGPVIENRIETVRDVEKLVLPDVNESLHYVFEAVTRVKQALSNRIPLIGFAGSPWTVACYAVEGETSQSFELIRQMLYRAPHLLHALLQKLTKVTIDYLNGQIRAGVDVIMLFDTWGGLLTTENYLSFSLHYLREIAASLNLERAGSKIPVIFFTKGGGAWLESIAKSHCDAVGLDWTIDLRQAKQRIGHSVALQGNLDPAVLLSDPVTVQAAVRQVLQAYGAGTGHVFNLGHGIYPETPIENVEALVDAVRHCNCESAETRL